MPPATPRVVFESPTPRPLFRINAMPAEAEPQGHQRYRVGQGGETAPPDPRGHQRYAAPGVPNATPAPPPSSSASPPWRRRAAFALNALIAAYALALAILALVIWTAPLDWWPVSLFLYGPRWFVGLPFLVLVPIALAFGPWRRRLLRVAVLGIAAWTLLVPILGLCVPWRTWLGAMRMTTTTAGTPPATRLRVLSANVEGASFDAARLALLIADARPDLVLLQEWSGSTEPSEFLGTGPWFVQQDYGLLLASRFPIRSHEPIDLASLATRGLASRSIVELPGGATVPVLNIHLPTPRPGLEALIARRHDGVDQFREITAAQWAASDAVRTRARVTDGLIVGGDFNLPIESPVFRHFWSDLTDAFSRAGLGLGFTRLGGWSIRVRIDHILSGPGWKAVSARVGPAIGSDHRPVLAELVRAGAVAAPVPSDARSVFLDPGAIPDDPKARPRLIAIPTPAFPAARAIWGATGRDASGRVWLGVSSDENQLEPPGSAHLMSLDPASGRVTDHADVLAQLDRLGLARPGQSQMKIHSRIVPGPDGLLYFASGDEAGADWDTARDPTWGGHLWRFHPDRPDRWEHLAATPESLIAVAAGGDSVYALGYLGHARDQYHVPAPSALARSARTSPAISSATPAATPSSPATATPPARPRAWSSRSSSSIPTSMRSARPSSTPSPTSGR
jgi:endonuclease/exonuclease/phosphatase (EEP) superfamily protein YafD